jgi:alpha-galactosidase/6-phospho-beta-glucosidase family protein
MDAKTRIKLVNALMTQFIKLYEDKYGVKPKFNRNTQKWAFEHMLADLGVDAQATMEYYFTLRRMHSPDDWKYNYEEINQWRVEDEEDEHNRRLLAVQTKERVEEANARWHQKPSE